MSLLQSWTRGRHEADGIVHDTYRKGTGPGVVLVHEMPGMTPAVIEFAEEVVARGYTVVMPHLFGRPEAPKKLPEVLRTSVQVCVSREFVKLALGRTAPVARWLRSLAHELHAELGGPGVGALGMCFTGGYALSMMVEDAVAAPVLAQPSAPFPVGRRRGADVGVSEADLAVVKERVRAGCPVLGLRYQQDPVTGTRFETLREELGTGFIAVELAGRQHSTLTDHRQQEAVDRLFAFFSERLRAVG